MTPAPTDNKLFYNNMRLSISQDQSVVDYIDQYGPFHPSLEKNLTEEEHVVSKYFGYVVLVDRTHKWQPSRRYKVLEPVPEGTTPYSFTQCVEAAAEEYVTRCKNKKIVLMWSGGLDSTCAFYALIKTGVKFTCQVNHHSMNEFPLLAAEILSGKYPNVEPQYVITGFGGIDQPHPQHEFDFTKYLKDNPDVVIMTGECGDQVFGSAVSVCRSDTTRQSVYTDVVNPNIVDQLDPTVLAFLNKPKDKITFAQWAWAVNFCCKWQNVCIRMGMSWGLFPGDPYSNVIHFFNTPDFQRWSMKNYEFNCMHQQKYTYKLELRKYLISQGCNQEYAKTKIKEGSLCRVAYK
jgi:hypothetical protein